MESETRSQFIEKCRCLLEELWSSVGDEPASWHDPAIPVDIIKAIRDSVNSETKTYRYVLPTQLLAKCVDARLDCRSIQASSRLKGAFDARSLCHNVIVAFDRNNSNVLGGSKEPYLNNPLRISAIVDEYRNAQKNKDGFDKMRIVLEFAQSKPALARSLMREVLRFVLERLQDVSVIYPVPNRTSQSQILSLIKKYLEVPSRGLRLQIVATALFRCIGSRFRLFGDVVANSVNAADAVTGNVADLECLDADGSVLLAVEVKDRSLSLHHAQDKIPAAREKGIRELLFLVQGGVDPKESESVRQLIDQEFTTGQNLYVSEFDGFLESCLVLFGETGRRDLLKLIGEELHTQHADISQRKAWAFLLQGL